MVILTDDVVRFFHRQTFVVVSTVSDNGSLHVSCKGIVDITEDGKIYLLDLYKQHTYQNLLRNKHITITAVDEHKFRGYSLKGTATIDKSAKSKNKMLQAWEKKLNSRITNRIIKNMEGERGHPLQAEALMPKPTYLISIEINEVVDLTPPRLKTIVDDYRAEEKKKEENR